MHNDRSRYVRRMLSVSLVLALASSVRAAVFTVTNTADSGPGSLRDAMLQSNRVSGIDTVDFAIPGDGVQTIQLTSPLPEIVEGALIDGYSQPGASPNTNPPGQGFNTVLLIEVRGPGSLPCFVYRATSGHILGLGIQGLVINNCSAGISVTSEADHLQISGNFIGTDPSGMVRSNPHVGDGIDVYGGSSVDILSNLVSGADGTGIALSGTYLTAAGNLVGTNAAGNAAIPNQVGIYVLNTVTNITIGGASPDSRNVISGNGTGIDSTLDTAMSIQGNFIGTDVTGTRPLGNGTGVYAGGYGVIIGNVIAANGIGLSVEGGSHSSSIMGNFIGTDSTATLDLGNRSDGISASAYIAIGGLGNGEANVIAHNGGNGVSVSGGPTPIRGNRIYDNRLLGVDLSFFNSSSGVTPNDPGDADFGGSLSYQNFPLITSVVPGGSTTHIVGRLNTMASQTYDIDLYSSLACPRRPNDYLQGETYLGSLQVTTDGFGNASFAVDVPVVLAAGQPVTATATDSQGNTSEFSQRIIFSVNPSAGPGGAAVTLSGMEVEPGASVMVGGVPASNVIAVDPQTMTATMPAFGAGTIHTVTVSDPSGLTSTLPNGWLADFTDVPKSHIFHDYVARLVIDGVAAGVGGGNYGVDQPTLREQMAVFLLKGKHGACFTPPPCTGIFGDVPCPSLFADWIEELAAEGVTAGCGNGDYCPGNPVLRQEMAVFLLKAEHGEGYLSPSCSGEFTDVACPSQYADWIEQLAFEQITGGCETNQYCPVSDTTRGQMAVFVDKTFSLP